MWNELGVCNAWRTGRLCVRRMRAVDVNAYVAQHGEPPPVDTGDDAVARVAEIAEHVRQCHAGLAWHDEFDFDDGERRECYDATLAAACAFVRRRRRRRRRRLRKLTPTPLAQAFPRCADSKDVALTAESEAPLQEDEPLEPCAWNCVWERTSCRTLNSNWGSQEMIDSDCNANFVGVDDAGVQQPCTSAAPALRARAASIGGRLAAVAAPLLAAVAAAAASAAAAHMHKV